MKRLALIALLGSLPVVLLTACSPWHTSSGAATATAEARGSWHLGAYEVRLDADAAIPGGITPVHLSLRVPGSDKPLFDTLPGESPLMAAVSDVDLDNGKLKTKIQEWCRLAHFSKATPSTKGEPAVELSGELTCPGGQQAFSLSIRELSAVDGSGLSVTVSLGKGPANQITLRAASRAEEKIADVSAGQNQPLKGERLRIAAGAVPVLATSERRRIDILSPPPLTINLADPSLIQIDQIGTRLETRWRQSTP